MSGLDTGVRGRVGGRFAPCRSLRERILSKVALCPLTGCWFWLGSAGNGYGTINMANKTRHAYRIAYEEWRGPIPEGLSLDHKCRQTLCVNPDHLEPVTHRENVIRGVSAPAQWAKSTHCPRGHERTPENSLVNRGRDCKQCATERETRRTAKRRDTRLAALARLGRKEEG